MTINDDDSKSGKSSQIKNALEVLSFLEKWDEETKPAFVAIEQVETIGNVKRNYEGLILKEMPDGSLKHVDGKDMDYLIANHPNFLKNWKLYRDQ